MSKGVDVRKENPRRGEEGTWKKQRDEKHKLTSWTFNNKRRQLKKLLNFSMQDGKQSQHRFTFPNPTASEVNSTQKKHNRNLPDWSNFQTLVFYCVM